MKENQMKSFGIRMDGRNELVLTNDQVRSLWYLVRRDYEFKKKKIQDAQDSGVEDEEVRLSIDLSSLQWQLNNAAYLAFVVGSAYSCAVALTPEMVTEHNAYLASIKQSVKPLATK